MTMLRTPAVLLSGFLGLVLWAPSSLTVQARAGTAEEVERSVQTLLKAFNKGDVDAAKGLMAKDHVAILSYARFDNAAGQLKVLSDWKTSEYKVAGLKVKT